MGYEHLIVTLKEESKSLISQEIQRRKTLLEKIRNSNSSSFEDLYSKEKQKFENKQKLM